MKFYFCTCKRFLYILLVDALIFWRTVLPDSATRTIGESAALVTGFVRLSLYLFYSHLRDRPFLSLSTFRLSPTRYFFLSIPVLSSSLSSSPPSFLSLARFQRRLFFFSFRPYLSFSRSIVTELFLSLFNLLCPYFLLHFVEIAMGTLAPLSFSLSLSSTNCVTRRFQLIRISRKL